MYTFNDVKKYLECAPVDEFGYTELDICYPKRVVHIYDSKCECNVLIKDTPTSERIVGKLYFDNDEVSMITVDNGVADFDNPTTLHIDTNLFDEKFEFVRICTLTYYGNSVHMLSIIREMAILGYSM